MSLILRLLYVRGRKNNRKNLTEISLSIPNSAGDKRGGTNPLKPESDKKKKE